MLLGTISTICFLLHRRQLKEIFDELGVSHKGLDKDGLRKLAYKENAVGRWEELHPEKKAKPRSSSGGGGGGGGYKGGDFGGKAPDGMDPLEWEKLMGQMKGNFAHEPVSLSNPLANDCLSTFASAIAPAAALAAT